MSLRAVPVSWRTGFLILFLILLAMLSGYHYFFRPLDSFWESRLALMSEESLSQDTSRLDDPSSSLRDAQAGSRELGFSSVDQAWPHLSTRAKLKQLIAWPVSLEPSPGTLPAVESEIDSETEVEIELGVGPEVVPTELPYNPGFIVVFGSNLSSVQIEKLVNLEGWRIKTDDQLATQIKPLIMVDHEGGSVQRLRGSGFSALPSWQQLCDMSSLERRELLSQSANEVADSGVAIVLAPVVDFGENMALGDRICASEPGMVVSRAGEFIDAFSQAGVLPILKHFPGIGQTRFDLHDRFDQVTVTPVEASVYREILEKYPDLGVMISHVGVVNQHAQIPCSLSPDCVGELRANFDVKLVVTDALEMASARFDAERPLEPRPLLEVAELAIRAGNDVLLFGEGLRHDQLMAVIDHLEEVYEQDPTFARLVERAAYRVVSLKLGT